MEAHRVAAVVQGNIRRGTAEILRFLVDRVDIVILSTWEGELLEGVVPPGVEVITNSKPPAPGYSHRNYQRASTAAGIRRAEQLGATHVLKWRTDMLPTKLNIGRLLSWSAEDVPEGLDSRYVTCAFRNLTVIEDWFSSIPDLFGFASIMVMKLVWGDEGFDYSADFNVPQAMSEAVGNEWISAGDVGGGYCAESELYAIFKDRLQGRVGRQLNHCMIAKNYMRLFDHNRLGICWFDQNGGFRSITQAIEHPWWTEFCWKHSSPKKVGRGYPQSGIAKFLLRTYIGPIVVRYNLLRQYWWYKNFVGNKVG